LDVVVKQYKQIDLDTVDDIAEVVQNAVLTIPTSAPTNANYHFLNVTLESANYLTEQDGSYFIVRKLIRFSQSLIQK